jgi:hypothetical protein
MFPPRSVPACVPSEPDGLGLSRSAAQAPKRASGRAHRLRESSRISRVPRGIIVLPEPPGPVTVTSRYSSSSPATSRTAPARPMKLVSVTGKPCTPPTPVATADRPTPVP